MTPQKIAIIGLGVMGGSLLLAAKRHIPQCSVAVITRKSESLNWAKDHGADFVSRNISELEDHFNFIFIATPSFTLERVAKDLLHSHH